MKLPSDPKLHVKVLSPSQTYYQGPAVAVSAVNKVGEFDILADHANFFSLLSNGDVVIHTGTQDLRFAVNNGIVKATNNSITLFVYLPSDA